jgi:uncharacterized protein YjiS (DUF1127 family)
LPAETSGSVCTGAFLAGKRAGSMQAVVLGAVKRVRGFRRRRRSRRHLAVMSERELQDIGIGRPEMIHEISKPFWR